MKTILRKASDTEIFGRMMKTANHGTFDGLAVEGSLPPYLPELCIPYTSVRLIGIISRFSRVTITK